MYVLKSGKKFLSILESAKELNFSEEQILNAIKIKILQVVKIEDKKWILYESIINIKESPILQEKITDEDEVKISEACEILNVTKSSIKKLIEDGYIKTTHKLKGKSWVNVIKRKEIKSLIPQIEEITNFWKSKTKINRQLGIKRTNDIRLEQINKEAFFINNMLLKTQNEPYYYSNIIKTSFYLLAVNYFIERKLRKKIIDQELINLYNESFIKFISLYSESSYIKIYLIDTNKKYIKPCITCFNKIKNQGKYTNCDECFYDDSYYSILNVIVNISDYTFNLNINYKDIRENQDVKKLIFNKIKLDKIEKMSVRLNNNYIDDEDLGYFKIYEVINYLKDLKKIKKVNLAP